MNPVSVFVPRDAAALSVGADAVAEAIAAEAERRGQSIRLVRTGSRGMLWLEPLVEVARARDGVRIAHGPVAPEDVPALFDAGLLEGAEQGHPLALGPTESIPYLAGQTRLTFARCGVIDPLSLADHEAHGGLAGLRRALDMTPEAICRAITDSGLRGRTAPASPPASSGPPCARRRRGRKPSAATRTRATAAPLPTAC